MKPLCLAKSGAHPPLCEALQIAMEMNARTWSCTASLMFRETQFEAWARKAAIISVFAPLHHNNTISPLSVSKFICIFVFEDLCLGSF